MSMGGQTWQARRANPAQIWLASQGQCGSREKAHPPTAGRCLQAAAQTRSAGPMQKKKKKREEKRKEKKKKPTTPAGGPRLCDYGVEGLSG